MILTLLTGEEVAQILNVSRSQAFSLMQRGDIPTIHIGKKNIRVRSEDLEQYIEKMRFSGDQSYQNIEPTAGTAGSVSNVTPRKRSNYVN